MTFAYNSKLMAQALSIVGEAGIHGMEYGGLSELIIDPPSKRRSKKLRWSFVPAHSFSNALFEEYLILAWRFGFVERSGYKELEWLAGKVKSSYDTSPEIVRLTQKGWEFIERYDRTLIDRWVQTLAERVPYVLLSIATAALTTWVISTWFDLGAKNENPTKVEQDK